MAQPSLTTCSGCGVASQLHGAFHNEPNSIRKFCPPCWEKRDASNSYIYFGTWLFLGTAGVVLALYKSHWGFVGSSRVDLQACKLEYSIVSPK